MSLLRTNGLVAGYGDFQALFGVSLSIDEGETIAIIGSNGAGKTTLLKTISGLLRPRHPTDIEFEGTSIGSLEPEQIVARGIAMVPEGRRPFPSLNVEDNLRMGGYCRRTGTLDAGARLPALSDSLRAAIRAIPGAVRRPAADVGHRPCIDEQSTAAAL